MRILLATTNKGKILELRQILNEQGIDIVGLNDSDSTEEIETGSTFAENALLKARHYNHLSGLPTIADDSGLEVEALQGAPGIHSARYAGPEASDATRVLKLLDEMKGLAPENRAARFVCAAAIVWSGDEQASGEQTSGERVFMDEARGTIMDSPRGSNGFGYDPIFYYEPAGKTFAELTPSEKAEVSHRGRAFRQLAGWLKRSVALDTSESSDRIIFPTVESSASSV
jgi:XTP/dITP diphosphohydrolase